MTRKDLHLGKTDSLAIKPHPGGWRATIYRDDMAVALCVNSSPGEALHTAQRVLERLDAETTAAHLLAVLETGEAWRWDAFLERGLPQWPWLERIISKIANSGDDFRPTYEALSLLPHGTRPVVPSEVSAAFP